MAFSIGVLQKVLVLQ